MIWAGMSRLALSTEQAFFLTFANPRRALRAPGSHPQPKEAFTAGCGSEGFFSVYGLAQQLSLEMLYRFRLPEKCLSRRCWRRSAPRQAVRGSVLPDLPAGS